MQLRNICGINFLISEDLNSKLTSIGLSKISDQEMGSVGESFVNFWATHAKSISDAMLSIFHTYESTGTLDCYLSVAATSFSTAAPLILGLGGENDETRLHNLVHQLIKRLFIEGEGVDGDIATEAWKKMHRWNNNVEQYEVRPVVLSSLHHQVNNRAFPERATNGFPEFLKEIEGNEGYARVMHFLALEDPSQITQSFVEALTRYKT